MFFCGFAVFDTLFCGFAVSAKLLWSAVLASFMCGFAVWRHLECDFALWRHFECGFAVWSHPDLNAVYFLSVKLEWSPAPFIWANDLEINLFISSPIIAVIKYYTSIINRVWWVEILLYVWVPFPGELKFKKFILSSILAHSFKSFSQTMHEFSDLKRKLLL